LDENDEYDGSILGCLLKTGDDKAPIYIIGNPHHPLGFMVASPDDPLAYVDPAATVSDLGQMRKDHGTHLKLYRVLAVAGSIASKTEIEEYNADCEIEDFDYSLIEEYLR
jgi:hypothetical protein